MNFQIFKLVLEKQRSQKSNANIRWIIEKAREFQKSIYFCFIDHVKAFDCGSQQTVETFERDGTTRPSDLSLEKPVCRSGNNS